MQCGTPSVTTTIGAESMHRDLPWSGFIEDDPKAFASKAVELYKNEELWDNKQQNGVVVINQRYDSNHWKKQLKGRLEQLCYDIQTHRQHNFIGSILHHHTVASTKFMSKWIEAKNRPTDS
jgi:hypothetical protein